MTVRLRRWAPSDLPLLYRANTPEMTAHLAGPETDDQVQERNQRYLRLWREGAARMFVVEDDEAAVGGIGWWTTEWDDQDVHETGWFILPEMQGRGIGRAALALLVQDVREHRTERLLTAFPSEDNLPSNALCRGAGFSLVATRELAFRGQTLQTNVWALDLDSPSAP
ncbi:GNAT family N-acetyltransferase [Microbacterium sp. M28]|uniref:GNAT family N-acetyltransferase n=1 Tax=Microbacterium sp. M28 TaxID=2962064 RepID=UPI0021F3E7C3|nr:GNAT family N-acetyltransferase [Microbacterium sp. M28]UYO98083.1 GNAT family N-acetyltransferase [Microbacterium sp. M28]